jgi:ligand-binding sensor domain-containing protein
MTRLLKQVFLYALLLFTAALSAQQKNIKFDRYSIEDGLSQSSITGITQDNLGYIWIATQDGLNRYDGYEFMVLRNSPDDSTSLPNNYLYFLLKDELGYLWFGTNRGLGRIDPRTYAVMRVNRDMVPDIRGYVFTHMGFDANGQIWALSDKYGINKINPRTKTVEVIKAINGNSEFTCLFIDHSKTVWVGTETGQIYYAAAPYNTYKEIDRTGIADGVRINQLSQNTLNSLLVSTQHGVFIIDADKILRPVTDNKILAYLEITCAYRENKRNLWVGTSEDGLFLLKNDSTGAGTQELFQYKKNPYDNSSIIDDNVACIFEDKTGVFWIGTEKGFSKFDKQKQGFTTISLNNDPAHGLIDYNVWSFAEDENKNIYVGTKKDLTIYKTDEQRFYHLYRNKESQSYLLSIYVESPGRIWLGYDDGLYLLTITDLKSERYEFRKIDFQTSLSETNDVRFYQIVKAD